MQGRIIKNISNDYTVLSDNEVYVCKSRGKFRNLKLIPLVGDEVDFDEVNNYILNIKPRKNELLRPPVSNVDQTVIVTSVKNPNLDLNLLDKLIAIIEFHNIKPIICFTKLDLLENKDEVNDVINYYKKIGYQVFINTDLENIKKIFKNKITVFTGQSGAGKSTLMNNIDESLNIKTDQISYALGRGKHTTRHVELIPLYEGLVADTPGFSSLNFYDMEASDIRDNFIEFENYKEFCKYRDCMHNKEDDCAVKEAVLNNEILKSRYENYIHFIKE